MGLIDQFFLVGSLGMFIIVWFCWNVFLKKFKLTILRHYCSERATCLAFASTTSRYRISFLMD